MRRYFSVYFSLLKVNFSSLVAYRSNFINNVVTSIAWGTFSILSVALLLTRTPTIFGWKREEILLLAATYSIFIGFFHMIFSRNFERMSRMVQFAELDYVLIKPIDSQFLLSVWLINFTSLFRVVVGIIFASILLSLLHIQPGISEITISIFLLFLGLLCLYSLWFSVTTLTIWFPRLSNIVDVMYTISSMSRFPREMFREFSAYLFYFLFPLMFIIVTPVKALLARASIFDFMGLLVSVVILFGFSRWFWKFALRFYTSASS